MDQRTITVDIEVTNRCNADCTFCPRAATPQQGLMKPDTFDRTIERVVEFAAIARERAAADVQVSLCGLGEPLINPHTARYAARVHDAGLECSVSSNGSLLDERRAHALLDAGVRRMDINCGEIEEAYDAVYGLPFDQTRDNIVRFAGMAAGSDCQVRIVLVNHRGRSEIEHLAAVRRYWEKHGITEFYVFNLVNRAGALSIDTTSFNSPEHVGTARRILAKLPSYPLCQWPFQFVFVGFDGRYYLCASDWRKEVPLGSVFERSISDVYPDKLDRLASTTSVCTRCSQNPVNTLAEALQTADGGVVSLAESMLEVNGRSVVSFLADLGITVAPSARPARRLIPVSGR